MARTVLGDREVRTPVDEVSSALIEIFLRSHAIPITGQNRRAWGSRIAPLEITVLDMPLDGMCLSVPTAILNDLLCRVNDAG
ncbi:hypothetical protein ABZ770_35910 [Streptomyces sp. NPDC006654]|uniref:hypothetical protein n=1 Tax=unclassified Streptomyces TaxID=2593676 RepID=UPI0033DDB6B4